MHARTHATLSCSVRFQIQNDIFVPNFRRKEVSLSTARYPIPRFNNSHPTIHTCRRCEVPLPVHPAAGFFHLFFAWTRLRFALAQGALESIAHSYSNETHAAAAAAAAVFGRPHNTFQNAFNSIFLNHPFGYSCTFLFPLLFLFWPRLQDYAIHDHALSSCNIITSWVLSFIFFLLSFFPSFFIYFTQPPFSFYHGAIQ
ncbi:hypothetical protein PILCRDRAFT_746267 [Piloderma croceum F 1598]|uniref:Uncharacterized protein n=1 Tax=Piloderma croceum (strain F 1598) TaxID=765440 RepID=A0A0C3AE96_PILCF|nr:hypothetical protein PILCRDRAFT_746267 [Piloderma croceum F 1598]